jgi:cobalamin synthase
MTMKNPAARFAFVLCLGSVFGAAHADGLSDLRGALARPRPRRRQLRAAFR